MNVDAPIVSVETRPKMKYDVPPGIGSKSASSARNSFSRNHAMPIQDGVAKAYDNTVPKLLGLSSTMEAIITSVLYMRPK